ncbi:MAG: UTP--glucose-1-phosphate uridylyltransferase [Pseudonocardiales bacterium]|nr:MAG: UTP--glucose-1-phosphate uridylyltransferase [Pseudonocardiales bacterium]
MPAETQNRAPRTVKAVIPAAGLGTRFLPATKAVPKELLPIVDRPVLQYIVEEAAAAGLTDVLLVTRRGKYAMVDYFDRAPELEAALSAKGDEERLAAVRRPSELADISTSRQSVARGLGHAVLCASAHVGLEAFAVMLGDDLIDASTPVLPTMLEIQAEHGGIVVLLADVPKEVVNRYGIASVESTGRADVVRITGLVEKPEPSEAPSTLAVIGRYVLPGEIFAVLRDTRPGAGGEVQLTDAMAAMLDAGTPVHGVVFGGRRYDTGDRGDYLKAVVEMACDREDLGPAFRDWLKDFVRTLP